jgi:hypothetical protein
MNVGRGFRRVLRSLGEGGDQNPRPAFVTTKKGGIPEDAALESRLTVQIKPLRR